MSRLPIDSDGCIDLHQVKPGAVLEVQTRNTCYTLVPQHNGEVLIWGHPEYCPEPTIVKDLGSTYMSGEFRNAVLCLGTRLSFPVENCRVTTSRIVSVDLKNRN